MIKIIPPESFKLIPWKNGKGTTTQLAINKDGTLDHFDWRISIASVVENGDFSDFSGYLRNLILIEGNGIDLLHTGNKPEDITDSLSTLLSFATFDGSCRTVGRLHTGSIQDFNLMTRANKYQTQIETWLDQQTRQFDLETLNFVFSLSAETQLSSSNNKVNISLPMRHLACVEGLKDEQLTILGENIIFIGLKEVLTTKTS